MSVTGSPHTGFSNLGNALPPHLVTKAVTEAIVEDLGLAGDITTLATVRASARASASIIARERGVVSGLDLARAAFVAVDPDCLFDPIERDGNIVEPGAELARISGTARGLLTGERVALNFMGRMSGIATLTHAYVGKIAGSKTKIVDTRKTTPGLRAFEKYAVLCGGGHNHRTGLFDAMMIKDNHILAAGGLVAAVKRARASAGHMVRIEVEVDTLAQLDELLAHCEGVSAVLLDNMDTRTLKEAVTKVSGRMICEASGGVSLDSVADIARTGVDVISVGALTHSPRVMDIGLDFDG